MSDIDIEGAISAFEAELPDSLDGSSGFEDTTIVGDQPGGESFTGFNPSDLPEDLQAVYRSMQGDYTRKTQEIAELRRNYEQYDAFQENGIDPQQALQATNFYNKLDTDPAFAQQVAAQLQQNLQDMGYGQPMQEDYVPENNFVNDESYDNIPVALQQELAEMRDFRNSMMEQQEHAELVSDLEYVEKEIRLSNPHYTDDDMSSIYDLAYSTNGDLQAAAQVFHGIQQRVMSGYLQSKQVPEGAQFVPSGPSTSSSKSFNSLDDAHKAALEFLRNSQ